MTKCGVLDWSIFGGFTIVMLGMSFIGVYINRKEQALKERCGHKILDCEIRFNGGKQLINLLVFAFLGGWISGALGLGGGSIFNPLMIAMGIPPTVSTSTGMYMIMLSSFMSSILYISYGRLNLAYAAWLGFWTSLGILAGLAIIKKIMAKYNRQSIIVFILAGVMGASALMVPIFQFIETKRKVDEGKDIWEFNNICKVDDVVPK